MAEPCRRLRRIHDVTMIVLSEGPPLHASRVMRQSSYSIRTHELLNHSQRCHNRCSTSKHVIICNKSCNLSHVWEKVNYICIYIYIITCHIPIHNSNVNRQDKLYMSKYQPQLSKNKGHHSLGGGGVLGWCYGLDVTASNVRVVDEWWTGRGLKRSDHDLIQVLALAWRDSGKSRSAPISQIPPSKIRTKQLSNVSLVELYGCTNPHGTALVFCLSRFLLFLPRNLSLFCPSVWSCVP